MKQFLEANKKEQSCNKSPNTDSPQFQANDQKDQVNKSGPPPQKDEESPKTEDKLRAQKV